MTAYESAMLLCVLLGFGSAAVYHVQVFELPRLARWRFGKKLRDGAQPTASEMLAER